MAASKGPQPRLRNPVSLGILIERDRLEVLRRIANKRDRSVSSMLRLLVEDFIEAEGQHEQEAANA